MKRLLAVEIGVLTLAHYLPADTFSLLCTFEDRMSNSGKIKRLLFTRRNAPKGSLVWYETKSDYWMREGGDSTCLRHCGRPWGCNNP